MLSKIVEKVRRRFRSQIEKGYEYEISNIEYQDELVRILYSENGLIKQDSILGYLNSVGDEDNGFFQSMKIRAEIRFQKDFASFIRSLFRDYSKICDILCLDAPTRGKFFENVENHIQNLYSSYKEYLKGSMYFYLENPGFSDVLDWFTLDVSPTFFDYVKDNPRLINYNNNTQTLLCLKYFEKIIFLRCLSLSRLHRKRISEKLTKFTKNEDKKIAEISTRIRNKIYKYKGIKCPESLVYILDSLQ